MSKRWLAQGLAALPVVRCPGHPQWGLWASVTSTIYRASLPRGGLFAVPSPLPPRPLAPSPLPPRVLAGADADGRGFEVFSPRRLGRLRCFVCCCVVRFSSTRLTPSESSVTVDHGRETVPLMMRMSELLASRA